MKDIAKDDIVRDYKINTKIELANMFESYINNETPDFNKFIKSRVKNKKIAIYGGGQMGRVLLSSLKDIPVAYILDKNSDELININGVNVIYPDCKNICDDDKDNTIIIVSIIFEKNHQKDEVYNTLALLGYKNIMNIADIWFYQQCRCYSLSNELEYKYYSDKKEDILKAVDLLSDENSIIIFKNFIKATILHQSEYYTAPNDEVSAYFVDDIIFNRGFSRFIECGALDGNTIAELINKNGKAEKIAIFEPDAANFKTTLQYIKSNKEQIAIEIYMYPCGVWSGEERLQFNENCMGASQINEYGTSIIQCVAIDDTLLDFAPTFLKMDIEGAEYDALMGAKQTIIKSKPDMAICVYHFFEHIWEIILLINSWNLGYKFYLRSHGCFGFGTTLYAVAD